ALRLVLFATFPATVGLMVLRLPIIQVLFERGQFDPHSTALTAWALAFFAVGLSGISAVNIVVSAFYALHDTSTPLSAPLAWMCGPRRDVHQCRIEFSIFHTAPEWRTRAGDIAGGDIQLDRVACNIPAPLRTDRHARPGHVVREICGRVPRYGNHRRHPDSRA